MKIIIKEEAYAGEEIKEYIERLIILREKMRTRIRGRFIVQGEFNAINIIIEPKSTLDLVYQEYLKLIQLKIDEYNEEYNEQNLKLKKEVEKMNEEANTLLNEFKMLDLTNTRLLVKWLYKIYPYLDRIGVEVDSKFIANKLLNAKYLPDCKIVNTSNEEEFSLYIIRTYLQCFIKKTPVPQIIYNAIEKWGLKFDIKLK